MKTEIPSTLHNRVVFIILLIIASAHPHHSLEARTSCSTSQCHATIKNGTFLHKPMKADACNLCHQQDHLLSRQETAAQAKKSQSQLPAGHPRLSPLSPQEINQTCFLCHSSNQTILHKNNHVHKPVLEGSCVSCHNPHHSNFPHLLKKEGSQDLCLGCHKNIAHAIESAKFPHKTGEKNCLNCHQPHESKNPHLLKMDQGKLCLQCHTRFQNNMKDWKAIHKPVAEGKCASCHQIHGSANHKLLTTPYNAESRVKPGTPPAELCMQCHKQNSFTQPRVSTETSFRNGDINLHFLHLKGKRTAHSCGACHEVHGSESPRLISSWSKWSSNNEYQIPIRFNTTPEGGQCTTACHGLKRYDRAKAINNDKTN